MKRRSLLGAGLAWALPIPAVAQPEGRTRVVGLLKAGEPSARFLSIPLAKLGWAEGRNVRFEVRVAAPDAPDLDDIAAQFVRSGVDVLVASGVNHVLALSRATKSIPIVCAGISDPVAEGVAHTLQQPGMNVTGLSFGLPESAALQFGTLRALVPGLRRVTFLTRDTDPGDRPAPAHEAAARRFGLSMEYVKYRGMDGLERALASLRNPGREAVWFVLLPHGSYARDVAAMASRLRLATHAREDEWVREGMLMFYWMRHADPGGRVAALVDKVLRGGDPGRIPFEVPDSSTFVLNRATARAIGLKVPDEILIRTTEVVG